jgi:predicted acylesterase/phospholipase RssA
LKTKEKKMSEFQTLVLSGSGARVPTQLGAAVQLQRMGLLRHIRRVVATSAGCFVALLISLRLEEDSILKIEHKFDILGEFAISQKNLGRVCKAVKTGGLVSFKASLHGLERILRPLLQEAGCATVRDIAEKTGIELVIVATRRRLCGSPSERVVYDRNNGDIDVLEAIMRSCSIPGYFTSVTDPVTGDIFGDGGITCNFPVNVALETDPHGQYGPYLGLKIGKESWNPGSALSSFSYFITELMCGQPSYFLEHPMLTVLSLPVGDYHSLDFVAVADPIKRRKLFLQASRMVADHFHNIPTSHDFDFLPCSNLEHSLILNTSVLALFISIFLFLFLYSWSLENVYFSKSLSLENCFQIIFYCDKNHYHASSLNGSSSKLGPYARFPRIRPVAQPRVAMRFSTPS